MTAAHLEVWGDPIDHSLSPAIHAAAYRELGWDWQYGRRRVDTAGFPGELAVAADTLRGLSVTMPLKTAAHAAAARRDERAELTGAVNTLLLTGDAPRGYNTDVGGIVRSLADEGIVHVESARLIGAGATATSALVALGELGAEQIDVAARRPEAVAPLRALGARLGIDVRAVALDASDLHPVPVTIAAIPGAAPLEDAVARAHAASGGLLLDVVYGHWPTALSRAWESAGQRTVSGAGMLLHQAVLQIRIFATGDVDEPLRREDDVVAVMRRALMGG